MNLIRRRNDLEGLVPLRRQMGRIFEDFFGEPTSFVVEGEKWEPALDVVETPETVQVKAEVAGINPKDIEISVNENILTLRGERREEKEEK